MVHLVPSLDKSEPPQVLCFDAPGWHTADTCNVDFNYPWLWCRTCRTVAHIDLVGRHIMPNSSHEPGRE